MLRGGAFFVTFCCFCHKLLLAGKVNPVVQRKERKFFMAEFTNRATLSYGDVTKISNQTVGEITSSLALNKKAVYEVYRRGDTVTYIVGITNASDAAYTGITLTDSLGRYNIGTEETPNYVFPLTYTEGSLSYWVNGVPQSTAATATVTNGVLVITPITVPASSLVQIGYEARVNSFAPLSAGSTITNTASLNGTGIATELEASETVSVYDGLDVEIFKALSPTTVSANGQITYTFTLSNYGSRASLAADNIVLTDNFTPYVNITGVNYTTGTAAQTAWTAGTDYTYTADGVFTTAAGKISVPAASYTQNPTTGEVTVVPGKAIITVTGTIG